MWFYPKCSTSFNLLTPVFGHPLRFTHLLNATKSMYTTLPLHNNRIIGSCWNSWTFVNTLSILVDRAIAHCTPERILLDRGLESRFGTCEWLSTFVDVAIL
jgi:hypothetical protein